MPTMRVEKHVHNDDEGSHNAFISSPNILHPFLFDLVIWKLFCRLNNHKQLEIAEDEKCAIRINYFRNNTLTDKGKEIAFNRMSKKK